MEITQQEALDCFASDDLIGIGMEADSVRRALHPDSVVTYTVPRNLSLDQPRQELFSAVEDCGDAGDTTICLSSSSALNLDEFEATLGALSQRFPSLRLRALTTRDILAFVESSSLSLGEILSRLRAAGLDSISGEDLVAVASEGLGFISLDQWLEVHRLAHRAGTASTAGLIFGLGETSEDRVQHLFAIRDLQAQTIDQTAGFTSFTLLSPKPSAHIEPSTAVEYLRTLAIARIVLDNVPSIESSCLTHGLKVTQMALRFGANDAGAFSPSSAKASFTEEDLRRVIRDAGFIPVERDLLYRTLFLNN